MAHQILKLQRMTDYKIGTTVNAGVISGGTKSNVVPDVCELEVDIRALTDEEMARITNEVLSLKPVMPGAQVSVEGGFDRPPMENDATMQATFEQAKEIAAQYGLTLRASGTGGASDGNYTAATGTPTLDGLGAVGDGAHSERENVVITDLPRRALLLAALLKDWPGE
jgi:glutamate carboxypeptidase